MDESQDYIFQESFTFHKNKTLDGREKLQILRN